MKIIKKIKSNHLIAAAFLLLLFVLAFRLAWTGMSMLYHTLSEPEQIETAADSFEERLNSEFPKKNLFVDINGLFHRVLMQRQMNGVVLLKNGMESELMSDRSEKDIAANAAALKQFSDWLESRDTDMFFCLVPMKNRRSDGQLPTGLTDYSNTVADRFLEQLSEKEVVFLDLREAMEAEIADSYGLYLKTEHHWNPYGGFFAFTKLCEFMEENFGVKVDPAVLDLENYNQDSYPQSSLGYYGQRTGFLFAGLDDFTLIYPKFETRQSCTIIHKELCRQGSFYDAVFDQDKFAASWRERGLYGTYIGGDYPLVIHHSETAKNPGTVMLFIDSYGTIPEAFLTTAFKNVIAVDLRWVKINDMGITATQFVETYKPDTVIVMFNPNQLGSADSDQFRYGID